MNFVFTQYGRQKSRQFAENRLESGIGSGGTNSALKPSTVKAIVLLVLMLVISFQTKLVRVLV